MKNRFGVACCCGAPGGSVGTIADIPGCFCPHPPGTLAMTSADPACNFGMFQNATLLWQPTPPAFAPLSLGANIYLSTASFPDPIAGGALFYYYLTCQFNQFSLTRIYPTSPYGSPYRDGILYTWLLGGANTCSPFSLPSGSAFLGSDASCAVTLH